MMNNKTRVFTFSEHSKTTNDFTQLLNSNYGHLYFQGDPSYYMSAPNYLGLRKQADCYKTSYYIGASWIEENNIGLLVQPKLQDINYFQLFSYALKINALLHLDYFQFCYGINLESAPIPLESSIQDNITPLLIIHYLFLIKKIIHSGLKKGYVLTEENLKSKIKGKILLSPNINRNSIPKRNDRNYCRYQIYTTDIPENRLLKKALLFCKSSITAMGFLDSFEFKQDLNAALNTFQNVSDDIQISQVKNISENKVYKFYREAIFLAKVILKRFNYSIDNTIINKSVPEYWIDMPRLFELFVLQELDKNKKMLGIKELIFQKNGKKGTGAKADYVIKTIDDKILVLDAKYKKSYNEKGIGLADLREISGYARDMSIVGSKDEEPICFIIYPFVSNKEELFDKNKKIDAQGQKINGIRRFRKFCLKMPVNETR